MMQVFRIFTCGRHVVNLDMNYAICSVPVAPVRALPSHRSEMVSQLLFGEGCTILESKDEWLNISCVHDGYEGWCQASQFNRVNKPVIDRSMLLADAWSATIRIKDQAMQVPMGSLYITPDELPQVEINRSGFIEFSHPDAGALIERSKKLLNTSYLWGGRSVYGIDCSGFCQLMFSFHGIRLPRDASQQVANGELVGFLQEARAGDLAFFDNEEGRIVHVGILIDQETIIHAAGKVRIDKIDTAGILNSDTGFRTHQLRIIKRFF